MTLFPVLLGQTLIHTCTVVQAAVGNTAYGHQATTWTGATGVIGTTGVKCRWVPKIEREQGTGAVISDSVLLVQREDAPASLRTRGSETNHRITNVLTDTGTVVDAGPFDIKSITDQAGIGDHYKLKLKRVG